MSAPARKSQSFHVPKRGNSESEYEDACAAAATLEAFAIADGATDSSYSGQWAKLLVEEFVRRPVCEPGDWKTWLPPLQKCWEAQVGSAELPWYAENKLQQGAFAAFLGVVIEPGTWWRKRRWRALAVGDCCLFHMRGGSLCAAFPMTKAADFNNRPGLVGSRSPLDKRMCVDKGNLADGDQLWLMTDALAKWFLQQHEVGKSPSEATERVLAADSQDVFASWIDELRDANDIRNDDVTLVAVHS